MNNSLVRIIGNYMLSWEWGMNNVTDLQQKKKKKKTEFSHRTLGAMREVNGVSAATSSDISQRTGASAH